MRILRYLFLSIILSGYASAWGQDNFDLFDRKNINIGISAKGGWSNTRAVGTVNLRGSYFLLKKLSLGLEFGYGQNGSFYKHIQSAVPIRYNFINRKLSPFTELSFNHFKVAIKDIPNYKGSWSELRASIGLSYAGAIKNKLGFEISVETNIVGSNPNSYPALILIPRITYAF